MFRPALVVIVLAGAAGAADPSKEKFAPGALGMKVPVLTEKDDYDKHLGKLVAVRGKLSKTKNPTLAGVDVKVDEAAVGDCDECYAVGILVKWVVKKEDVENSLPSRGAGTFYTLYFDLSGKLAEAKPVPKK